MENMQVNIFFIMFLVKICLKGILLICVYLVISLLLCVICAVVFIED